MKNQFIITLLCLPLIGTIATAQTKKPIPTRKPSTTVQSSAPKTTAKTSTTTTTTTTIPNSTTAPVVVEEKKTMTTTTTTSSPTESNSSNFNSNNSSGLTTIQQSSSSSKGNKKPADPKPDKVVEPKPEKATEIKDPTPEKVRTPSSSLDGTGFHIGIKGGANNFFFLGNGKVYDVSFGATPQFSVGFHGGLVANYGISETFALQLEALYVQQKTKFADGADNATYTNNGIEVPLALQLNFGGDTKFFINAGGYLNYGLSGSVSGVVGGTTIPSTKSNYSGLSFNDRSDYGVLLGLGAKFNQALFIEARANYSVKDGTYTDTAGKKIIPVFAGLSLGYFF